jgi:hypothetical protein
MGRVLELLDLVVQIRKAEENPLGELLQARGNALGIKGTIRGYIRCPNELLLSHPQVTRRILERHRTSPASDHVASEITTAPWQSDFQGFRSHIGEMPGADLAPAPWQSDFQDFSPSAACHA